MARIVAIAEVYDALTAPDSYRGGHSHEWAVPELRRVAARQLVELFLNVTSSAAHRPSLDDELIAARRMAARGRAHAAASEAVSSEMVDPWVVRAVRRWPRGLHGCPSALS